jgi:hypothetical protein
MAVEANFITGDPLKICFCNYYKTFPSWRYLVWFTTMSLLYSCEKCPACSIETCTAIRSPYNDASTMINSDDVHKLGLMAAMTTASYARTRGKALPYAGWHHLVFIIIIIISSSSPCRASSNSCFGRKVSGVTPTAVFAL